MDCNRLGLVLKDNVHSRYSVVCIFAWYAKAV